MRPAAHQSERTTIAGPGETVFSLLARPGNSSIRPPTRIYDAMRMRAFCSPAFSFSPWSCLIRLTTSKVWAGKYARMSFQHYVRPDSGWPSLSPPHSFPSMPSAYVRHLAPRVTVIKVCSYLSTPSSLTEHFTHTFWRQSPADLRLRNLLLSPPAPPPRPFAATSAGQTDHIRL